MKKIVIVPSWIQRTLSRERRMVTDVLSFSKLCDLLSPQDLSALVAMQSHESFSAYTVNEGDKNALVDVWKQSCPAKAQDALQNVLNPSNKFTLDKDHLKALISGETRDDNTAKGFEVIPASHGVILLILKDGYFGSQDYDEQDANIVENILRVLYGEFVQEEVAQTTIFSRYVRMLSNRLKT